MFISHGCSMRLKTVMQTYGVTKLHELLLLHRRYVAMCPHSGSPNKHHGDVMISVMASQITGITIVYQHFSADQIKHRCSALLPFVRGIHRWPGNSPHKKTSIAKNVDDVMMKRKKILPLEWKWCICPPQSVSYLGIMMTSSNGNIFRVTGLLCGEFTGPGEFLAQRPVTRSFDVFFDLRLI